MQQLFKQRGKDEVINVRQRNSLYQTIDRLLHAGLIGMRETTREGSIPERTIYHITEAGRQLSLDWMKEMLAMSNKDFPEFPVAIAFLPLLTPEQVLQQLQQRIHNLETALSDIATQLQAAAMVPRLFLLESEYVRAITTAELEWVRAVVSDLQSKRITWSTAWLEKIAAQFNQ
ncbi:Transcriptional regulator [Collimonas arenae]|uniref:Transcriptional regulator n=1 Tax=Collimonas arenae TaxID=279058 RepID=A0A0A1FCR2_9BURK|nr:Transcriptional regulator [Collimonas arenae]